MFAQTDEQLNCCIHRGILFSHKQMKSCHCDNMNEPGVHCAKWNEPEAERQTLPVILMHRILEVCSYVSREQNIG